MQELDLDSLEASPVNEDGSVDILALDETEAEDNPLEESEEVDLHALCGENLADTLLEEEYLEELAETLDLGLRADLESLQDHFETIKKGVDLLGIKLQEGSNLGDWACGASHPLIIENAIKFQASVVNELDRSDAMVKTRIVGSSGENNEIEQRALRIQEFMNYYIPTEMDSFFSESAKCALGTALFGTGFKKNVWNTSKGVVESSYLRIDQVITNYENKSLDESYRYTELCPSSDIDIIRKMNSGVFRKVELCSHEELEETQARSYGQATEIPNLTPIGDYLKEITGVDTQQAERLLAYHYLYIDVSEMLEDSSGVELDDNTSEKTDTLYYEKQFLPFIVIQELTTQKILGVYANWNEGDDTFTPKDYITDYHFIRGFGFYSLGYIHVLGNFSKMLTSIMRSLVDAGTFANLPGGFKLKGSKMAGDVTIVPGEFVDIESGVQDISKAIMPLPFKEPSAVLTNMYQILEGRGQAFANATEGVVSEATNYGPVGTTMALLDASSKLTTGILKDFHRSRRKEFQVIYRTLSENAPKVYPYEVDGQPREIFADDFNGEISVIPVSDPNIPSQAQRMAIAQQKLQIAQQFPQQHNLQQALRAVYLSMGEQNPDRFLTTQEEPQPLDPLSDFMAASQNKPIKAFPGQDHQAHISFKQAILGNPEYSQSEFLQGAMQALAANIREHMVMDMAEKIEKISGTQPGPEQVGSAVAQAEAAKQLMMMQQQVAQAQLNAQDPTAVLAQVQMQKVLNDEKRIDSAESRDFAKLALEKERLELEKKKLAVDAQMKDNKIKADLIRQDQTTKLAKEKMDKDALNNRTNQAINLLGQQAKVKTSRGTQSPSSTSDS